MLLTAVLIRFKVGLAPYSPPPQLDEPSARSKPQTPRAQRSGSSLRASGRQQSATASASNSFTWVGRCCWSLLLVSGNTVTPVALVGWLSFRVHRAHRHQQHHNHHHHPRFVDGVGVVDHPPFATLNFPITNAPTEYPQSHNFAAQADESDIKSELAAAAKEAAAAAKEAAAAAKEAAAEATAAKSRAAAAGAKGTEEAEEAAEASKCCRLPQRRTAKRTGDVEMGVVAPSPSSTAVRRTAASSLSQPELPLKRSPSGAVDTNPVDPGVAVRPRLTAASLFLRTLPIWLTVLVLLLTRIPALRIKAALQRCAPACGSVWRAVTTSCIVGLLESVAVKTDQPKRLPHADIYTQPLPPYTSTTRAPAKRRRSRGASAPSATLASAPR